MKFLSSMVAAALVASVGIAVPWAWPLVFPGIALFFFLLLKHTSSAWRAAVSGLLFGFLTGGAGIIWFWSVLPLDFLGITNPSVQWVAVAMTWAYVAGSLAIPIACAAPVLWAFRRLAAFPLIAAVLWCVAEQGRMWSFALTTWSPQSLFGPHFSAAAVGYAVTENSWLLQLARPYGVDALNGLVAFSAALAACTLVQWKDASHRRLMLTQVVALVSLVALVRFVTVVPTEASASEARLRMAIVAENIDDVRNLDSHSAVIDLLIQAAAAQPPVDVVLLPEEFSLTSIFWSKQEADGFIRKHFGERDVLFVHTRNALYPADERNVSPDPKKLVYESTRSGEIARYVKLMLMPLGEYAPALTKPFFSVLPDPELHMYINDVSALPPRGTTVQSVEFRGVKIGGLLCSDLLSPLLYRSLAREQGVELFVNLANQFWFHSSRALYWKTVQIARVHAVQNGVPLLVANNMAPSFALDRNGRMLAQSGWGQRQVLYVDYPR